VIFFFEEERMMIIMKKIDVIIRIINEKIIENNRK